VLRILSNLESVKAAAQKQAIAKSEQAAEASAPAKPAAQAPTWSDLSRRLAAKLSTADASEPELKMPEPFSPIARPPNR